MDVQGEKIKQTAMRIIEIIYQGDKLFTEEIYDSEMELWLPHIWRGSTTKEIRMYLKCFMTGVHKIWHKSCTIIEHAKDSLVITGNYDVEWKEKQIQREALHYTMIIKILPEGKMKLRYLHISSDNKREKKYYIQDIQERVFFIVESELLYLEAVHNHVIWHCEHFIVETTDSLKKAEERLSDNFYRVQRSFIVNINHIRKFARCYIELDNSETISIPVKRYCAVREHILNIEKRSR